MTRGQPLEPYSLAYWEDDMRASDRIFQTAPSWPRSPRREALAARLSGPGGFYNLGNLIGLVSGLALQIGVAAGGAGEAVAQYLAGSAAALFLTAATLVFMVSGEAYHRAWEHGFPPVKTLNISGDFLSGIGALALGAALLMLGQPLLAATSGLLHAFGKFGSALYRPNAAEAPDWPRIFRILVVASRVPAILAALLELGYVMPRGDATAAVMPATLLICYALWARADVMLMKG
jgi:hypothetical protein